MTGVGRSCVYDRLSLSCFAHEPYAEALGHRLGEVEGGRHLFREIIDFQVPPHSDKFSAPIKVFHFLQAKFTIVSSEFFFLGGGLLPLPCAPSTALNRVA